MLYFFIVVLGRTVSILQDKAYLETDLWLSNLQFLALLLTEEGKRQAKGGNIDEKTVKDRLDNPITNGMIKHVPTTPSCRLSIFTD